MNLCKCCNCGKLYDESDLIAVEEDRGEFWGSPCTETMYYSPCCRDYVEEYREEAGLWICEDCGKIWDVEELDKEIDNGVGGEKIIIRRCPDCLGGVNPYVE